MTLILSNTVTTTITNTPSCNCPTGDVCANSNGTCPANSFPDQLYSGCCVPCNQLVPASVSVNVPNTNIYYVVNHTLQPYGNNPSYLPYAPVNSGCTPSCAVATENNGPTACYFFDFIVSGSVTDSAGHGICNQKVNIQPQQMNYEVSVSYNEFVYIVPATVTIGWSIQTGNGETTTDSNGNYKLNLKAWATPYKTNEGLPFNPGCYQGDLATQPITIQVSIVNTGITNIGVGDIYLNTWDNGGYKI